MGKLTNFLWPCSIAMLNYQRDPEGMYYVPKQFAESDSSKLLLTTWHDETWQADIGRGHNASTLADRAHHLTFQVHGEPNTQLHVGWVSWDRLKSLQLQNTQKDFQRTRIKQNQPESSRINWTNAGFSCPMQGFPAFVVRRKVSAITCLGCFTIFLQSQQPLQSRRECSRMGKD